MFIKRPAFLALIIPLTIGLFLSYLIQFPFRQTYGVVLLSLIYLAISQVMLRYPRFKEFSRPRHMNSKFPLIFTSFFILTLFISTMWSSYRFITLIGSIIIIYAFLVGNSKGKYQMNSSHKKSYENMIHVVVTIFYLAFQTDVYFQLFGYGIYLHLFVSFMFFLFVFLAYKTNKMYVQI